MDWTLVTRSAKQRRRRTVQIFVNVVGSRTIMIEMVVSDKVSDIVKRIPTSACCGKSDVYVMCEEKVLRRGEELMRCGVEEKKRVTRQEPVSNKGPAIPESEKDAVIQMLEGTEGYRDIIRSISEARDEGYGTNALKVNFMNTPGMWSQMGG